MQGCNPPRDNLVGLIRADGAAREKCYSISRCLLSSLKLVPTQSGKKTSDEKTPHALKILFCLLLPPTRRTTHRWSRATVHLDPMLARVKITNIKRGTIYPEHNGELAQSARAAQFPFLIPI